MSEATKNGSNEWRILRYFMRASLPHKRSLLISLAFPFGALALSTIVPYYTGKLLAELSINPDQAAQYLPYIIGAGLVGVAANRIGAMNLFEHQARVISDLQMTCLNVLLRQSTSFHNNRVAGKLVSDAIDFTQASGQLANAFFVNIIPLSITIITGVVLVSLKSLLLGAILFGMAFAVIGLALIQSKARTPLRKRRLAAMKAVTGHLADTIVNNQTVKTFAEESFEMKKHLGLNKELLEIRVQDWRSGAATGNNRILGLLVFQVIFAIAVIHVVRHDPSTLAIGIFAFSYSIMMSNNLMNINGLIRLIEDSFLQASPMMEILEQTPSVQDKPGSKKLIVKDGGIALQNVRFGYQDAASDESVFDGLNLVVAPGEKIGLVGPSGGGKSTLTRLLLRFDDIQNGEISIDGQNIADVKQKSLRQAIAYVPQEPLMFHRSVLENISYGKPGATKDDVIAAAKQANAHDFINKLPKGYDTLVGERGVKLSGGQRQRVAIARALLKDAPILILDEATSALDSESEVLIQEALRTLMKGRTTLVIAHRLSTIQKMDRIIVMEDGAITEEGTHSQLLKRKGTYARLWKHQSGGFLEEE